MPFSRTDFFDVFARYNEAVWPAQFLLYALATGAVLCLFSRSRGATRGTFAILAILWLWMGAVYHGVFFATINPMARVFAAGFVVQAMVFTWIALRNEQPELKSADSAGRVGLLLTGFALAGYPLFTLVAGHIYPAQPTVGLPCPTTIFTLGILLLVSGRLPRVVFVIPMCWALIGSLGAFMLGVPEDISLVFALAATVMAIGARLLKNPEVRHA